MSSIRCKAGEWEAECLPDDGGRIARLRYGGRDLLTTTPARFRPPTVACGAYEERPVYGYDDCLPSVDSCGYPGMDWEVPDHGELCWLPWKVENTGTGLMCRTASRRLPLEFERELAFAGNVLTWHFRISNTGSGALAFQHIMHPLMPLNHVSGMDLPDFAQCLDEGRKGRPVDVTSPATAAARLMASPPGTALMWLLQETRAGVFRLRFDEAFTITVRYDHAMFPTLGIWWNRDGYPDEDGCRRNECAFEPIPGPTSRLSDAHAAGQALRVEAGGRLDWAVAWMVTSR